MTNGETHNGAIPPIAQPNAKFIAGGTNLLDLMKENVEHPARLIDINRLEFTQIAERDGGLRLGALAKNSDTANHRLVRERYPLVTQAILAGASTQLRKAARVAMGGVAHTPWRATKAEAALKGQRPEERIFRSAAEAEMQSAVATEHNRFKIELGRRAIVRALTVAATSGRTASRSGLIL